MLVAIKPFQARLAYGTKSRTKPSIKSRDDLSLKTESAFHLHIKCLTGHQITTNKHLLDPDVNDIKPLIYVI